MLLLLACSNDCKGDACDTGVGDTADSDTGTADTTDTGDTGTDSEVTLDTSQTSVLFYPCYDAEAGANSSGSAWFETQGGDVLSPVSWELDTRTAMGLHVDAGDYALQWEYVATGKSWESDVTPATHIQAFGEGVMRFGHLCPGGSSASDLVDYHSGIDFDAVQVDAEFDEGISLTTAQELVQDAGFDLWGDLGDDPVILRVSASTPTWSPVAAAQLAGQIASISRCEPVWY